MITKLHKTGTLDKGDEKSLKMLQQIAATLSKFGSLEQNSKVIKTKSVQEDERIIEEFLARNKKKRKAK